MRKLSIVAIALTMAACSTPAPQQSETPVPAEQTAPAAAAAAPAPQQSVVPPAPSPVPQTDAAPKTEPAPKPEPVPARVPPPVKPRVAHLEPGLMITVRTTRNMSSKTIKTGDVFSSILEEGIAVNDWVVVPAGAKIDGRIVESDDGGRLQGKAKLAIELTALTTGDGQKIEIVTSPVTAEALANRGKDAAKVGVGAGAGAAIGAIGGGGKGAAIGAIIGGGAGAAMRGDAAEIPAESVVSFELRTPVDIQERKK